ncbi:MAG: efflux RND transporter periplasmic adaptor subunit [Gammaproteobacteria bacterium]|nr:efflux RND transporter periplasmic adaptor subunit [Gammaproteobacteria bacterium]
MTYIHKFLATLILAAPLPLFISSAVAETLLSVEVIERDVQHELIVDGVIEATHRTTVSAQTSGQVKEVLVDIDDYVNKGDVIVRLNDSEQRSALRAAEARAAEAKGNFERSRGLLARELVSAADFEKAEAAYKAADAARAQAQEQLEYTVIRAPYSGIVVARHLENGEIATPGREVMTGISLESLRAVSGVPQSRIDAVRNYAKSRVIFSAGQGRSIAGAKITFAPYADPLSHTFKVRVNLPDNRSGDTVYPGTYVKVAFIDGVERQLVVPANAIVYRGEVTAVYVIDEERIALRMIRSGRALDDGMVEIFAGLQAGERVAVDPIAAGKALKERQTLKGGA